MPIILSLMLVFGFVSSIKAETIDEQASAIPVMTSNTVPSGKASSSSSYSGTPAWKAFDGMKYYSDSAGWKAWGTNSTSGWLSYVFPQKIIINKYTIYYSDSKYTVIDGLETFTPKTWTFEGSNDDTNWVILDSQTGITDWAGGVNKEFSFENNVAYKTYRLNISANNGSTKNTVNLTIHELGMFEKSAATPTASPTVEPSPTPEPTPEPTVTPSPTPEQPTGERAILVVTMNTGLEKEFDLPMSEINAFLNWYDTASGSARYGIDKHNNNKGPFTSRKDYVIFDKILTFSVDEYSAE
ncbi:ran-binding protein 10 [Paenibacillus sp. sgz500992]|uniref:ran-binding protein 10 n=1 Tax=Paenibacillus sp. sgz500992 TaxID=3242476 RepID=UPI0036D23849